MTCKAPKNSYVKVASSAYWRAFITKFILNIWCGWSNPSSQSYICSLIIYMLVYSTWSSLHYAFNNVSKCYTALTLCCPVVNVCMHYIKSHSNPERGSLYLLGFNASARWENYLCTPLYLFEWWLDHCIPFCKSHQIQTKWAELSGKIGVWTDKSNELPNQHCRAGWIA